MNKNACSGSALTNKLAFLEMLGSKKQKNNSRIIPVREKLKIEAQIVLEENEGDPKKTASQLEISVSSLQRRLDFQEVSLRPSFDGQFSSNPSRKFFEKITRPWKITSFDISKKEVCVEIDAGPVKTYVSTKISTPL